MSSDIRSLLNKLNECACGGQGATISAPISTVTTNMSISYSLADGTYISKNEFASEEEFAQFAEMVRSMEGVLTYSIHVSESKF